MKNSIFTLILLFSLSTGCSSEKLPEEDNMPYQSFSYLALGDSYTIGQGVPVQDRYPVQLQDRLANANVSVDSLLIIARTGWTTDELSRGIDATETHPPYDLVTLLIGVNNQFRGRDPENYRDEFVMLLNRAIGFAGDDKGRVVVLSIPDWGVTPFASGRDRDKIAREIDLFNAINREESENAGVAWLDVTEISRLAVNRPELLAPDGLHPSGLMYQMWVDELFPIVKKILTEN
jgi:lysophospholipase L1-like esterase